MTDSESMRSAVLLSDLILRALFVSDPASRTFQKPELP
jgi:hypothetical protein